MVYQVKHNSFFMEFVHNFNSLKSVLDFVKGSCFQAVKEFEIISWSTKIEDLKIDSMELCKNSNWNLKNLVKAAFVEFNDVVQDYDFFEYRNNFDENLFLHDLDNLSIPGLIALVDSWLQAIEIDNDFEIIEKCEDIKKSILKM